MGRVRWKRWRAATHMRVRTEDGAGRPNSPGDARSQTAQPATFLADHDVGMRLHYPAANNACVYVSVGLLRELNPGPLTPGARIMPLDQAADDRLRSCFLHNLTHILFYPCAAASRHPKIEHPLRDSNPQSSD